MLNVDFKLNVIIKIILARNYIFFIWLLFPALKIKQMGGVQSLINSIRKKKRGYYSSN